MNLTTFTTQIASAFTLVDKDPKRTVGRQRHSMSPKPPVGRNPAVTSPMVDIQFGKVTRWPEIDGNRSRCQKCNNTCTVICFKCKVGLCLNKDRHCFKNFHNQLLVFSHSFLPKKMPQAALIFCQFYYPFPTILHNCSKLYNWHLKLFSESNCFLSLNNTKE